MNEKQKEYQRKWNKDHPDKVREYKRNSALRSAIRDILENGIPPMKIEMEYAELEQLARCVYWLKTAPGSPQYISGGGLEWVYDYVDMDTMRTISRILQTILIRAGIEWQSYEWDVVEDYRQKRTISKPKH